MFEGLSCGQREGLTVAARGVSAPFQLDFLKGVFVAVARVGQVVGNQPVCFLWRAFKTLHLIGFKGVNGVNLWHAVLVGTTTGWLAFWLRFLPPPVSQPCQLVS